MDLSLQLVMELENIISLIIECFQSIWWNALINKERER